MLSWTRPLQGIWLGTILGQAGQVAFLYFVMLMTDWSYEVSVTSASPDLTSRPHALCLSFTKCEGLKRSYGMLYCSFAAAVCSL